MAFYVRGDAIENAKGYELRKKVTSDGETTYPLVDSKKAGMVYFNEVGGLGADGWENSDTDCIHTPFIAIEDLEDSYVTPHGCVSSPYFDGAMTSSSPGWEPGLRPNPFFYALYEKADYSSYILGTITYPEDVGDNGFSTFLSDIKSTYTWDDRAKYIVFSVKKTSPDVNENGMFVNLRKDISFRLEDYPDTLPAGQTHQLVVKAIGEGGVDLDGDGKIYADSEYGGDVNGDPLEYTPVFTMASGEYTVSDFMDAVGSSDGIPKYDGTTYGFVDSKAWRHSIVPLSACNITHLIMLTGFKDNNGGPAPILFLNSDTLAKENIVDYKFGTQYHEYVTNSSFRLFDGDISAPQGATHIVLCEFKDYSSLSTSNAEALKQMCKVTVS